jgi:hypothetical protein
MTNESNTHSVAVGYIVWIFGYLGAHRFYFGRRITGTVPTNVRFLFTSAEFRKFIGNKDCFVPKTHLINQNTEKRLNVK